MLNWCARHCLTLPEPGLQSKFSGIAPEPLEDYCEKPNLNPFFSHLQTLQKFQGLCSLSNTAV